MRYCRSLCSSAQVESWPRTKGRGLSQYGLLALAESSEKVFQFFRGQGSTSTWKAQRPAFENGYRLEESWLAAGDLGKQLVSTFG
jgi:hypothetical protein